MRFRISVTAIDLLVRWVSSFPRTCPAQTRPAHPPSYALKGFGVPAAPPVRSIVVMRLWAACRQGAGEAHHFRKALSFYSRKARPKELFAQARIARNVMDLRGPAVREMLVPLSRVVSPPELTAEAASPGHGERHRMLLVPHSPDRSWHGERGGPVPPRTVRRALSACLRPVVKLKPGLPVVEALPAGTLPRHFRGYARNRSWAL